MPLDRFDGWIAGLGTTAGPRVVIGRWAQSPLGAFTDVMLEWPDGHRMLLAPEQQVADYVTATYRFDEVRVVPVTTEASADRWRVTAGPLDVRLEIGRRCALGVLLRAVPRPLATAPTWIRIVDAIARRIMPGIRTRGSAGGGREELYAALDLHLLRSAKVTWQDNDQGGLAPVTPPVRFGFGSTPRTPSVAKMITLVQAEAAGR